MSNALLEKTILIVEDDHISRELLHEILIPYKVIMIFANDGLEAIERCKEHTIDIILMDIHLPNMDGKSALKEIRKFNEEVPVIAQTAFAMTGDREKYLSAGFDDYIAKPINPDSLFQVLNNCLMK